MKLWMSSEQMQECFENMQIQREIKPKINELIKHCTLGEYNVWNVITIVLNENGPNYKEIIRRSLKNRELEFRLKIDYDEFIKSNYEHKKKLVIELLLRSLDLMEKWKEIKKEEREKIKLIIEEEFKEILEWKKTGNIDNANDDFDSLNPQNVKDIPGGRTGKLPLGRKINVRDHSSDGRPTLEIQDGKNQIWRVTNMFKILLKEKYDIQSFYLKDSFEVLLSSPQGIKRLNFGDRIVYTKFYEEEVTNRIKFPYYNLLGENIRTTTLLQEIDSQLIKQIESDTGSFYSAEELKHYVIIAENYIMEIVSYDEVQFY